MMEIKLKKYDAYKDSGVEWLVEIPESWEISRLGKILSPISKNNRADLPLLSITREKGVILRNLDEEEGNHNFIPDDLSNYKVLEEGQFGMNKMKAWQGSYGIANFTGIVSPAYFIFKLTEKILPAYFHIAIRSRLYISFFGSASDGVRIGQWDLSKNRMNEIPFLVPTFKEQTAIAKFLDDKTAKIDQAIAIKQKQIDLLKERRQILIHKAVTRGINPNMKLKDSGVEWIGEIPEHWNTSQLKWASKIYAGGTPDKTNIKFWENGFIPWIASGEVNQEIIDTPTTYITELGFKNSSARWIKKNSLVIALAGQGKTKGMVAYLNIDTTGNQSLAAVVPNKIFFPKYLFYFAKAAYGELRGVSGEGQRDGLNLQKLGAVYVCIPPLNDQQMIVRNIETALKKIDKVIYLKEMEIEKLKEYKASLINSVVTGKINVM